MFKQFTPVLIDIELPNLGATQLSADKSTGYLASRFAKAPPLELVTTAQIYKRLCSVTNSTADGWWYSSPIPINTKASVRQIFSQITSLPLNSKPIADSLCLLRITPGPRDTTMAAISR